MSDLPVTPHLHAEIARVYAIGERVRNTLQILSEAELCAAIGVKTNTLQVWRSEGQGPAYTKLGKSVFYEMYAITCWVAKNRVRLQGKDA